jgi:carboxyl-terminal processing protease
MKPIILTILFVLSLLAGCMKDEFGGIGIEVPTGQEKVTKKNPYIIASVFKGGSGEAAGLKPGDSVVSIDGQKVEGLQQEYIVNDLLRGKVGSEITLEIEREIDGKKTLMIFKIQRIKIVLQD